MLVGAGNRLKFTLRSKIKNRFSDFKVTSLNDEIKEINSEYKEKRIKKMKTFYTLMLILTIGVSAIGQNTNPNYDSTLAKKYGADQYGMKGYILVILKTGINKTTDKEFIRSCFAGHMKNINHLVKLGKLIVAGPLGKNEKTYRGIFILNITSLDEAKELLQTDPAIKENILEAELYNWYGSAALSEYLETSDKIWKTNP